MPLLPSAFVESVRSQVLQSSGAGLASLSGFYGCVALWGSYCHFTDSLVVEPRPEPDLQVHREFAAQYVNYYDTTTI